MFGNGAKLINFDKVQESYLLQILINEDEPMPQISSKIPRLSETELTGITQWIELGLP